MMQQKKSMEIYRKNIEAAQAEWLGVKKRIYRISLIRVFLFGLGLIGVIHFFSQGWEAVALIGVSTLLPFLALMKWHNRLFHRKEYLEKKIEVNQQELEAMEYRFSAFDSGEEYVDPKHVYSYDLDLFGENSLFQSINRTSTFFGKRCLASWFNHHLTDQEEIVKRQQGVRELALEWKFWQHLRILGLLSKSKTDDQSRLDYWMKSRMLFRQSRFYRWLPNAILGINVLMLLLVLLGWATWSLFGLLWVCFVIYSINFSKKITQLQTVYQDNLKILSTYAEMMAWIEKRKFNHETLQTVQQKLSGSEGAASVAVARLAKLMNSLDQRNNVLVTVLLNGLSFWEMRQVLQIEAWKSEYADRLMGWLEAMGEMEAFCSLSAFAFNHQEYTYPTLCSDTFRFHGKGLGHPLLHRDLCVKNPVNMIGEPFFVIVTGANMAGKSTYLRTIGVNYLLACIGAPVCADELEVYPAQLVTSLRTTDSLCDHESYFFAELKRLKMIIDRLNSGEKLFIVLDEILKGTNSLDKQKGSLALIKQFVALKANGIIATHDLLLGTLADIFPDYISNYCFEAEIRNEELVFAYLLKTGIAQNMNACFLMKKMGIAVVDEE